VNGDVAAAGCDNPCSSSGVGSVALCGWQLTLDALDSFQSLGHLPLQTFESESAASMCKVCSGCFSPIVIDFMENIIFRCSYFDWSVSHFQK